MMMKRMKVLTERQERFVVEFATIGNSRQAALKAGYSNKVAGVMGCRMLKMPAVRAALDAIKAKDNSKLRLTRERVLAELAKGLFRDPVGLENADGFVVTSLKEIPPELRTIIDGFKVTQQLDEDGSPVSQKIEVKLVPKASVIDMGMKHLGAYAAEKQESKVSLDWGALYGRSPIVDPAIDAIGQIDTEINLVD